MDKVTTVLNNLEPKSNNTLWLKPVSGGFVAYLREQGAYKPLKLMNDNGTPSTDDDTPIDPSTGPDFEIEPVETASAMWNN